MRGEIEMNIRSKHLEDGLQEQGPDGGLGDGPDVSGRQMGGKGVGPDRNRGQIGSPIWYPTPTWYTSTFLVLHPLSLVHHLYLVLIPSGAPSPYLVPHSPIWYSIPDRGIANKSPKWNSSLLDICLQYTKGLSNWIENEIMSEISNWLRDFRYNCFYATSARCYCLHSMTLSRDISLLERHCTLVNNKASPTEN